MELRQLVEMVALVLHHLLVAHLLLTLVAVLVLV
jgi:hypothetical protein